LQRKLPSAKQIVSPTQSGAKWFSRLDLMFTNT
jgi:hypothetical protein